MTASLSRPAWPLAAFVVLTAIVYSVAMGAVVPMLTVVSSPGALAAALVVDLVLLVPVAYAVLMVRLRGAQARTLVPVVGASVVAAWWVVPAEHRGLLDLLVLAVPALEIGALLLVGVALVRALRRTSHSDAYEQIREAVASSIGDHAGSRALAYELAISRYALGRSVTPDAAAFHVRRGYGALLAGLLIAMGLELVGGHILVTTLWGPTAGWIHLALSGYALLWIAGDYRALGARPITLGPDTLHIRTGLRWSIDVPVDAIQSVHHVRGALPTDAPLLDVSVTRSPQFILELATPVTATGPYGIQREIGRVALGVDEPDRFLSALATAMQPA